MLNLKHLTPIINAIYDVWVRLNPITLRRLREDPVYFAEKIMGFKCYPYQADLLRTKAKRIVACWGRQSGKTTAIALKVIHFVYTNPNVTVLIVSKGLRQSIIMFSVITNFILGNPILRRSVTRYTRTQIFLKNGSRVIALPCSQDGANLRGHTAHMVVMDEAAFMPEPVITSVIFPMLATTDGTAIMLSTPWGRNHIFFRSFVNPNYWTQHIPSTKCPRISKEFLEEQRREIGDLRFRIEYLAEFIEDQNALFTQDMIRGCVELWNVERHKMMTDQQILAATAPFTGEYYLGCDLGKRLDYSVVCILKREKIKVLDEKTGRPKTLDPVYRLVYMKQFELRTKLSVVFEWIRFLYKKFNITWGCIDRTGIGEAVAERLEETCPNLEGVGLYSAQAKQEVMMYLYTTIENRRLIIPYDKELIAQMNEQQYYYGSVKEKVIGEEKGVMLFAHPEGRHDDMLWALASPRMRQEKKRDEE